MPSPLPCISVILPTCRRPEYLAEAVASVCAQTLPPAELLVVETHSGAREALTDLAAAAPFPVRVLSAPGAGPGAARNVGLAAAAGELVAFLDDDDLWHPEKLARQAVWMQARPSLGVLGTAGLRGSAGMWCRPPAPAARLRFISRPMLVRANRLLLSSVLARRAALLACGGFEASLPLAQDWDLWLRVANSWEVATLPTPLTHYRQHSGQRTARRLEVRQGEVEVLTRALAAAAPGSWLYAVTRRRLAWARCREGRARLRAHQPELAARAVRTALSLHPSSPVAWLALAQCRLAQFRLILAEES